MAVDDRWVSGGATAVTGARARGPRAAGWRTWGVAFAVFSLLGGWWALASPLFSVPDEPAHAVYAAGVVRGQVFQERADEVARYVTVPSDFADANGVIACYLFQATVPAGCAGPYGQGDEGLVEVATTAGSYPPAYYALAGLPTLVTDGVRAVYLMRLVTVVATAALLASALVSVLSHSRTPWPAVAVATAVTPMVLFLAGGVNPQAPEIAAGLLLWCAGWPLLAGRGVGGTGWAAQEERRLVLRVCVAAGVLAVVRPLAPLWLFLVVVVLLVALGRRERLLELLRRRDLLVGVGVVAALGVGTVVWVVAADTLRQIRIDTFADLPLERAVLRSVMDLDGDLRQMVGVFGWLDTNPPAFVHLGWIAVVGVLGMLAAAVTGRRPALALGLLVLLGLTVPVVLEVQAYRESSFAWQGRYILPLLVGFPVVAGYVLDRRDLLPRPRPVAALLLGVLVVCHVGAFVGALNRNIRGTDGFWVLDPPRWAPPLPTAVLVLALVTTLVVAAVLLLRHAPRGGVVHRRPVDVG